MIEESLDKHPLKEYDLLNILNSQNQVPTKVVNFGDTGETIDREVPIPTEPEEVEETPIEDDKAVLEFQDDIVMPNAFTISQDHEAFDRGNVFDVEMAVLRKSFDQIMHENFEYEQRMN